MKRTLLLNLFALLALTSLAQADLTSASKISCTGVCTGGTMEGMCGADIVKESDGSYTVNDIAGGQNKSDSSHLELDTIPVLLGCHGARVSLDLTTGKGSVEYKYNSGIIGGGCQTMKANAVTCTESK